ncbi:hypothetical protein H0A71_06505 [Alcaligenaceae bacterium]|nr:hypothetical protein [Alcaligenaceae bacterium]
MTHAEYRDAAIAKLRAAGMKIATGSRSAAIVTAIEKLTGREYGYRRDHVALVRLFVDGPAESKVKPAAFRAMCQEPRPRLAEINAAQPPMRTPCGTGNERELSKGLVR